MLSPKQADEAAEALLLEQRQKLEARFKKREARRHYKDTALPVLVTAATTAIAVGSGHMSPINAGYVGVFAGLLVTSLVQYINGRGKQIDGE